MTSLQILELSRSQTALHINAPPPLVPSAFSFVHRKHLARVGRAGARAWPSGPRGEVVVGQNDGMASATQDAGAHKA